MRKSIILVIALIIYGVLVGAAWAAKVSIGGTHSQSEIQGTCGAVGGDFFVDPGGTYGCSKVCAGGSACTVTCTSSGNCTGECPRCGKRVSPRSPLPRLAGGDAVTRVLNNSVRRTKRY
jgi:hypothetical protein